MRRRPDIEGLRAVAVIPIMLLHAGLSALPGGFLGVDVFFVISGFLITSIIIGELDAGRFSLMNFYRRRAARILPALLTMLVVVVAAGYVFMLPSEFRALGGSVAAAAGFLSNVYFWRLADYFAAAAESEPLIHTWSLGIEEQFYLLYPIFLLVLRWLFPGRTRLLLVIVTSGAFAVSLFLSIEHPHAAFYLLPSRAWELGLGGVVALGAFPRVRSPAARNALALIGVAAIVVGFFAIRPESLLPAPWGLLPCGGAALQIAYGQGAWTERALAARPLQFIGRISYSLYLWHWPIIVFYRLEHGWTLGPLAAAALIAVSVAAATLSYFLVEQPFRSRFRTGRPWPVVVGAAAMMVIVAAGAVAFARQGTWRHYAPDVLRIVAYRDAQHEYQYLRGTCFAGDFETVDREKCLVLSASKPNVVVLGDSHAAQYWRALSLRFPDLNVLQATASGCRPTLDADGASRCTDIVSYVLGPLAEGGEISEIVLGARWLRADLEKLERTVRMLRARNIEVVVIGPTVEYDGSLPQLLARAMAKSDLASLAHFRVAERKRLSDEMAPIVTRAGGRYISAYDIECPRGECRLFDREGGPFHFDYGHLTFAASRDIVDQMPPL